MTCARVFGVIIPSRQKNDDRRVVQRDAVRDSSLILSFSGLPQLPNAVARQDLAHSRRGGRKRQAQAKAQEMSWVKVKCKT